MKEAPRQPLFLARQSYRRRRLMDAARLLPVLGALLFLLPVLWAPQPGEVPRSAAQDGIYMFAVWAGLILAAFLMARALASETKGPELPETGPVPGQPPAPPPGLPPGPTEREARGPERER